MSAAENPPGLNAAAIQQAAVVVENVKLARDTFRMRLHCPDIAARIRPGQFFMVRKPVQTDPLLGRPFALFDIYCDDQGRPAGVDFGYLVVGKLTGILAAMTAGESVEIWGPLGNGFPEITGKHLACVAGGIGQTPFLAVLRNALGLQSYGGPAQTRAPQDGRLLSMFYGVRNAEYLAGVDAFTMPGVNLQLATDDGSHGHHGYVTELLQSALAGENPPDQVFCCGPEPMMHAVADICQTANVRCWLSLETPMACGFGACFSCVTRVRLPDGTWDYRRTCIEGPVFPAEQLMLTGQ